jgi:hypothetical protein
MRSSFRSKSTSKGRWKDAAVLREKKDVDPPSKCSEMSSFSRRATISAGPPPAQRMTGTVPTVARTEKSPYVTCET